MPFVASEDRIPCESEISNLPVGPLHLLNLLLTSCLHLGTMRRLSFIEHRAMMLECTLIVGFWNMFFLVRYREKVWRSWMLVIFSDGNDESAQQWFTRLSLRGTRVIQKNGVMASYCLCSKRLSSDLLNLLTNRITQVTCKCYTMRSLRRRWTFSYRISLICSSMEPLSEDTWAFNSTLSTNPVQRDGSHLRAAS